MNTSQKNHLKALIRSSYLGAGELPPALKQGLDNAVRESISNLRRYLA